jgi:hypothetical protein
MNPSSSLIPECHSKSGENMDITTRRGIFRWLLILSLLVCGLAQGIAQNKATQWSRPSAQPPTAQSKTKWIKDPSSVMPMRKMTNTERRAAAQRNKTRRAKADAQRKHSAPANQGVQQ